MHHSENKFPVPQRIEKQGIPPFAYDVDPNFLALAQSGPDRVWCHSQAGTEPLVHELEGDLTSFGATNYAGPVNPYDLWATPQSTFHKDCQSTGQSPEIAELLADLSFPVELPSHGSTQAYLVEPHQRSEHTFLSRAPDQNHRLHGQRASVPGCPATTRRMPDTMNNNGPSDTAAQILPSNPYVVRPKASSSFGRTSPNPDQQNFSREVSVRQEGKSSISDLKTVSATNPGQEIRTRGVQKSHMHDDTRDIGGLPKPSKPPSNGRMQRQKQMLAMFEGLS